MKFRLKWTVRLVICLLPCTPPLPKALGTWGKFSLRCGLRLYTLKPMAFQNLGSGRCHWTDHLDKGQGATVKLGGPFLFPDNRHCY